MKLNKTFGRIATTLVATAMLASLAAPVYAEPGSSPVNTDKVEDGIAQGDDLSTITLTKKLVLPDDVPTPDDDFTFTVKPAQNATGNIVTDGETFTVFSAPESAIGSGTASVNGGTREHTDNYVPASGTAVADSDVMDLTLTITLPDADAIAAVHGAGIYKYDINETLTEAQKQAGYIDMTNGLDMYLIVERTSNGQITSDDAYKISGVIVYPDGATSGDKADVYVNYYKLDGSGTRQVGDLSFTKEITGAMGNKSDTFKFTVTGDGIVGNTAYTVQIGDAAKTTQPAENGVLTFEGVGNGKTITIFGIDDGTYTVTETNPGSYDVTYSTDTDADTDGAQVSVNVNRTTTLKVTNNREAVSPTGLVMDIAPYVLLVVVAAAGCFVFLRKRRED